MIDGKTFGLGEYFRGQFPSCFKQKSENQKSLILGRAELDKETNIVRLVQNQRYFISALNLLLTPPQQAELKKAAEKRLLDLDETKAKQKDSEDPDQPNDSN